MELEVPLKVNSSESLYILLNFSGDESGWVSDHFIISDTTYRSILDALRVPDVSPYHNCICPDENSCICQVSGIKQLISRAIQAAVDSELSFVKQAIPLEMRQRRKNGKGFNQPDIAPGTFIKRMAVTLGKALPDDPEKFMSIEQEELGSWINDLEPELKQYLLSGFELQMEEQTKSAADDDNIKTALEHPARFKACVLTSKQTLNDHVKRGRDHTIVVKLVDALCSIFEDRMNIKPSRINIHTNLVQEETGNFLSACQIAFDEFLNLTFPIGGRNYGIRQGQAADQTINPLASIVRARISK